MPIHSISAESAQQRIWRFGRADGSVVVEQMRLAGDGRIVGATNANETAWRLNDGCVEFVDADGDISTRFDSIETNESGAMVLRGRFLGYSSHEVVHMLTEMPDAGSFRNSPRVAVLLRTHLLTDKLLDLLTVLKGGLGYELFVCADETRGSLALGGEAVVGHSEAMCAEIGLLPSIPNHRLLWYFGDYAFYCAQHSLPNYDYYVLIEYDVEFVRGNALLLEGLLNRLEFNGDSPYDLVATHYGPRPPIWPWSETCDGRFDKVYGALFPLVVLSKRALSYLYEWRCREAANPPEDGRFVFCEAFVPSALIAAGGFRCADVRSLIPGSWHSSTFRVGKPMLLGALPMLKRGTELVHPVFSEREYLIAMRNAAQQQGTMAEFVATLSDPTALPITPALRSAFLEEAIGG